MSELHETQYLISNLSLPPPLMMGGSIAGYERYMSAIGADGLELTPVKTGRFMGGLLERAQMLSRLSVYPAPYRKGLIEDLGFDPNRNWAAEDEAYRRLVRAQHSSFRNHENDDGLFASLFPVWRKSLKQMAQIQLITGKRPAVLYPRFLGGQNTYNDVSAPFLTRSFQPSVGELKQLGLTENAPVVDVRARMKRFGFTEMTLDVFHVQDMDKPVEFAARMAEAGVIRSLHLALNRLDMTGLRSERARRTKHARKAFVESTEAAEKTLEGEIVRAVASGIKKRRETTKEAVSLSQVVLEDGPLRLGGGRRDHRAILEHARALVAAA
ncbi:MAG TPA: hypothetical protein VF733_04400 [Candidatus Saccharimonadales bacterium]